MLNPRLSHKNAPKVIKRRGLSWREAKEKSRKGNRKRQPAEKSEQLVPKNLEIVMLNPGLSHKSAPKVVKRRRLSCLVGTVTDGTHVVKSQKKSTITNNVAKRPLDSTSLQPRLPPAGKRTPLRRSAWMFHPRCASPRSELSTLRSHTKNTTE